MSKNYNILKENISAYKRKYYLNQLIKNSLVFIAICLTVFVFINSIEFTLQLGIPGRTTLFFTLLLIISISTYKWLIVPLIKFIQSNNQLSDEDAAKQIGHFFPEFGDKLLNIIQLQNSFSSNDLVSASIVQKTSEVSVFKFTNSIDLRSNNKYLKYILFPGLTIILLLIFLPQFFTESTARIVNYNKEFESIRLFQISPITDHFKAFKNEDFLLEMKVQGSALPENIYVFANGRKHKMNTNKKGIAQYTFPKVQANMEFSILASDYKSKTYDLTVLQRPDIKSFNATLSFPTYIGRNKETLSNVGNLVAPEGTSIEWLFETLEADEMEILFSSKSSPVEMSDNQLFKIKKEVYESESYQMILKNKHSRNKDSIVYTIDVIKDEFPNIAMNYYQDTTLYSFMVFNGQISDDYGVSALELVYSKNKEQHETRIPFSRKLTTQNFFYQWPLDSLDLKEGDLLEFFVRVWDNDGVNGRKSNKSGIYSFKLPEKKEINEKIDRQSQGAKNDLDKTIEESKDLNEQIKQIQNELKSKKDLDWQDEKRLNELIDQKTRLEKELKKLSEQNKKLSQQREHFNEPNKDLQEKARQLQQLMDEVLDEETKKLYEELKKLLEENSSADQVEDVMEQIQNKEENMEQEIERALEMFKRMQFDYKMDDIINELEQLQKEQSETAEQTKNGDETNEELKEKQKEHNESFEEIKEEIEKLKELNDELKEPEQLDSHDSEQEGIENEMQESMENLENKKRKKASQSQQNASDAMKKLQKKMEDMQAGMEMQALSENLENLRSIVENLVKLSFDQETIMKDFRGVNQSDPRYVSLSQKQLKLKDDALIVKDSLLSLANRVFQIQSFVTRELDEMNDHVEASLQALKDRHKPEAVSSQQYAMTSINNLALLLDDVLQQMQQQMADAMGKPQKGKKGQKQEMPGLSELQKQLNKKIEDLKKSGKTGRPLSQQLAELAAEQEMLRQQLQQMEEQLGDNEGGKSGMKDAIKKMEETETDLVNKRITRQTINRQKEILTRMLEVEGAMRERELDQQRKGEEAKELEKKTPPEFEEYFKAKEKELDLLHTVPSKMNPYYKEEVNKYFRRLNEQ